MHALLRFEMIKQFAGRAEEGNCEFQFASESDNFVCDLDCWESRDFRLAPVCVRFFETTVCIVAVLGNSFTNLHVRPGIEDLLVNPINLRI